MQENIITKPLFSSEEEELRPWHSTDMKSLSVWWLAMSRETPVLFIYHQQEKHNADLLVRCLLQSVYSTYVEILPLNRNRQDTTRTRYLNDHK